jgi:hypothetical protein
MEATSPEPTPEVVPGTPTTAYLAESPTSPSGKSKRVRRWATVAMVAGLVGAIVSVVLLGGVWVARGYATDKVDGVTASINEALNSGLAVTQTVSSRLDDVASSLSQASADAAALAATATPSQAEADSLVGKIQDLGARYDTFRANYLELREKVLGALSGLTSIERLVPQIQPVTDALTDAFNTLDGILTKLDGVVANVRSAVQNVAALPDTARSLAAGTVANVVTNASTAVQGVTDRITSVQTRVNQLHDDVSNYFLWAAIAGTVAAIWLFLVHVGLFAFARRVRNT